MLRDDINNAVKDAMRAKEERKLSTLRMVNASIKNADIEEQTVGKSAMPEDFHAKLSAFELRDLVEYLSTLK